MISIKAFRFIHHFIQEIKCENISDLDHSKVTKKFQKHLEAELSNEEFIELLIYSGYIPDIYSADSSEEKLHTKLTESLVAEWSRRLSFNYIIPTQKSGKEDITIKINNKTVVADAKSFRLGRSQGAPNHKDFLKLESINSWMSKHQNAIGGLITFPHTHDWSRGSGVYEEATNKRIPTVILTYIHMAYILKNYSNFNTFDLTELWDYDNLFPNIIEKYDGPKGTYNNDLYWEVMNKKIAEVTNTSLEELQQFFKESKSKKEDYITDVLDTLESFLESEKKTLYKELDDLPVDKLKEEIVNLKIKEDNDLFKTIKHIKEFRFK